jgi:parvulin-like peptidyl-prolyl isomerase
MVLASMRRQFLDGLVDKIIILDKAKTLKVDVTAEELTAKIAMLKKTNDILDEAAFNKYLQEQGISEAQFRSNIRDIMLMEKTRDKFFSDITVPDSEAMAYYRANGARYARETIRAAHILIKMPAQDIPERGVVTLESKIRKERPGLSAEALKKAVEAESLKVVAKAGAALKEARAGKDFAALARKYSEDASAKNGGELGNVNRGDMLPEIDNVLFSLKKDSIAGPVRSRLGLHIVKALSDPRKEVRPFEEVKNEITGALTLEKRQARLKSLRDNAKIKVLWDIKN